MSLSSNASNVLLAKCRAKYGRRLTLQDINAMISCRSVTDVTAYLKANTHYGEALASFDPSTAHRRNIELALRRELYEDFSSLCRYELSVGEWFGDYLLMRSEIEQIMSFLCLLSAGRPQEFIFSLPTFFVQHSEIDFTSLSQCRDYNDFLLAMRSSRYIKTLRAFIPLDGEQLDIALVEHGLYRQFYDTIWDIITTHYSGTAREELLDLTGAQLDILNFCHIYRLKRYYGADSASVRAMLLRGEHRIRAKVMKDIIEAPTADAALELFITKTPYGRQFDREDFEKGGIETATQSVVCAMAQRLLRSSIHPTTVLLSYIILATNELQDVTSIVEGVHYGLSPDEILSIITVGNTENSSMS